MPADTKLSIAVVGLGATGRRALPALRRCPAVDLVGAADRDPDLLEGLTGDLPTFTDSRSMLAQTRPQAVYLALPPAPAADLIGICAEWGIHVIKEPPLARDLAEAAALIRQAEAARIKLAVATGRRFMTSYRRAFEMSRRVGPLLLARAHYVFNWGPVIGWRADRILAGGGALLELGYPMIDLLVWMHGAPEDVFGATTNGPQDDLTDANGRPAPPSATDDAAAAVMRSARGATLSVVVSRASGPLSEELVLHGPDGSLAVGPHGFVLRDSDGGVLDERSQFEDPADCTCRMVEAFGAAIHAGSDTCPCSARASLLPLAVTEALYLSEKTASAENPQALLRAAGFSVKDCLVHRPADDVVD